MTADFASPPVGRVALVTGAARGIGAATVRALAARGYGVMAVDWCIGDSGAVSYPQATSADLADVVSSCPAGSVIPVVADVRDARALARAAHLAVEAWDRLDTAVAAAALICGGTPQWSAPPTDLDLLWEVNVKGLWNTAAATIPLMSSGPDPAGCRFVAIASAAGSHGLYHLAAYTVTKHAAVGLVRALAADLVGTGITAVAVSPGATDTDMLTATAEIYGVSVEDLAHHQLLRRMLSADELAATVAFCCSPEAGSLNGGIVHADGGFAR